ncbi:MAG: FAD:protein FMN transferase [Niabella sp.]
MRNWKLFLGCLVVLFSCAGSKNTGKISQLIKLDGYAQGTTFSISYIANDSAVTMAHVMAYFHELDQSLSIYKQGSLINQFNESEEGVPVDHHLKSVVQKAFESAKASNGLFDITVFPLVNVWGFGNRQPRGHLPDSMTISQIKLCVDYRLLQLQGSVLYKKKPCVKIDVNGIAQGYSVDFMAGKLAALGIKNYLIEIGGEVRSGGRNIVLNRDWIVGVEQPATDEFGEPLRALVRLKNVSLTTSGNYRKFYTTNGKYVSHLIDPRTGYSFTNNMVSATVLSKNAITADAYDNVLMGLGMEKAIEFVKRHKELEAYIIYKNANGDVADTMTAGFKKYILKNQDAVSEK